MQHLKTQKQWLSEYPQLADATINVTCGNFPKTDLTFEAKALLRVIPNDRPVIGAEIGLWMAKTACILLRQRPQLKIIGVDNWEMFPIVKKVADYNIEHFGDNRLKLVNADSTHTAQIYNDETFDYVFIDASKDTIKYYQDVLAWYPKVKKGGVMIGHDIDHPTDKQMGLQARIATEACAHKLGFSFEVDPETFSWVTYK